MRRELIRNRALEDKDIVAIVDFGISNSVGSLVELYARVLPLRCAKAIASRMTSSSPSTDQDEQFQEQLKTFSKMEMRLLNEVMEKLTVLTLDKPSTTEVEKQRLESMLVMFSAHQCPTCAENDACCIL